MQTLILHYHKNFIMKYYFLSILCIFLFSSKNNILSQEQNNQFYFKNKWYGGFTSILYTRNTNVLYYGFINAKGDSIETFDKNINIEVVSENASLLKIDKKNSIAIIPKKNIKELVLVVKYKNNIIKEQKFNVYEIDFNNILGIHLVANNPKNKILDLTKPIPVVDSLFIRSVSTDPNFRQVCGGIGILSFQISLDCKKGKYDISVGDGKIDLKKYNLRPCDKITIAINSATYIMRGGCPESMLINKKFVVKFQ